LTFFIVHIGDKLHGCRVLLLHLFLARRFFTVIHTKWTHDWTQYGWHHHSVHRVIIGYSIFPLVLFCFSPPGCIDRVPPTKVSSVFPLYRGVLLRTSVFPLLEVLIVINRYSWIFVIVTLAYVIYPFYQCIRILLRMSLNHNSLCIMN
jgi:hypothetical protein